MDVRNLRWIGVATDDYERMVAFVRDTLGLRVKLPGADDGRVRNERGRRASGDGPR